MGNIWDRFDNIASAEEVATAKDRFTPISAGDYEAVLEKIEATESQKGLPMVATKFRTLENRVIFDNKMLQNINNPDYTAGLVADAVKFVGDLLNEDYTFTTLSGLAEKISTIPIGGTYTINVSYGKKDIECKFAKVKVVKPATPIEDVALPFDL